MDECIDIDLQYTESAFRHGISDIEIEECLFNEDTPPLILRSKQDASVKIALGQSCSGQYLEIAFRVVKKNVWCVFHAMPMREAD
ncbi:MAG: hypothetical protein ACAI44_37870, partial [Candidatus Sericytochromatia bacterium]